MNIALGIGIGIGLAAGSAIVLYYWLWRRPGAQEVSVCPECGCVSHQFKEPPGSEKYENFTQGEYHAAAYACKECGYKGIFPLMKQDEVDHFRKNLPKNR